MGNDDIVSKTTDVFFQAIKRVNSKLAIELMEYYANHFKISFSTQVPRININSIAHLIGRIKNSFTCSFIDLWISIQGAAYRSTRKAQMLCDIVDGGSFHWNKKVFDLLQL